jgi:drug/metabolite transporter (DMT)-like permease
VAAAQGKDSAAAIVVGGARKAGEIELWIPITIAAAFLQNLRSMLQNFIYATPFAVAYVAGLAVAPGFTLPTPHTSFALYTMTGGLAQIVATALLIYLFSFRNFAVGTTYSKTETVQTAIFGLVILGDQLSVAAMVAILVSLSGVVALSSSQSSLALGRLLTAWTERTALIGLASGTFFGVSAVSYRAAALSLGGEGVLIQAAFTLACVLCFQTLVMGGYLLWREPGQFKQVLAAWPVALWVGVAGMLASVGWFTAMTLQNAAYVRALGQIELVFTFLAAHLFFRESSTRLEVTGILLIIGGILILLLG